MLRLILAVPDHERGLPATAGASVQLVPGSVPCLDWGCSASRLQEPIDVAETEDGDDEAKPGNGCHKKKYHLVAFFSGVVINHVSSQSAEEYIGQEADQGNNSCRGTDEFFGNMKIIEQGKVDASQPVHHCCGRNAQNHQAGPGDCLGASDSEYEIS